MANAACDAMVDLLNSGLLKIYAVGSGVPADVATAITDQPLLAELTLNATAFGDAAAGVATAGAITGDTTANNTGTASFYRISTSGGTASFQGLCGTSASDLNLNSTAIQAGAAVDITSLTITEGLG
jgi:phage tail sheath gpL-like